jgi:hypothetical protein
MKTPLLALYERSLRVESRNWLIALVRLVVLGILLLMLLIVMSTALIANRFVGAPGLQFFEQIAWLNFGFITFGGVCYFASAVTEEKEEMTLGLLRMTGLNPLAILLGKSTARLTGAILLVLVQFPFTLLAVTLGGVSTLQIVSAYCALLAYLALVGNLALLWSVVFQRTLAAALMTGFCLFLFLAGPHIGLACLPSYVATGVLASGDHGVVGFLKGSFELLIRLSPITSLHEALRTAGAPVPLNAQFFGDLALGAACFGLAWLLFERCTREQKDAAPTRPLEKVLWARRGRVPAKVIGALAITWKESSVLAVGFRAVALRTALFGLVYAAAIAGPLLFHESITRDWVGGSLVIVSLLILALGLAVGAGRIFLEEVQWKTLASLVLLPISTGELVYRKVIGRLAELLPVVGFLLAGVLVIPDVVGEIVLEMVSHVYGVVLLVFGLLQFVLFLHLVAFLSLVVKRWALPLAFVIHYLAGNMCMVPFSLVFALWQFNSRYRGLEWLGFLLGMGVSVGLIYLLQRGIVMRLRRAAAEE